MSSVIEQHHSNLQLPSTYFQANMSSNQSPSTPSAPTSPNPQIAALQNAPPNAGPSLETLNKIAWGAAIGCPLLILLPPRKMDFYTFALICSTAISANHLRQQRTGLGIIDGMSLWMKEREERAAEKERQHSSGSKPGGFLGLPAEAREVQRRMREEQARGVGRWDVGAGNQATDAQDTLAKGSESRPPRRSALQGLWYGNEGSDWIEKRREEEARALEEGKSYAQMIGETIWEVWSGGKAEEERSEREMEKLAKHWEEERRRVKEEKERQHAKSGNDPKGL